MTTPEFHARASDLFTRARRLPEPQRERLLADADPALRDEVRSLLRFHDADDPADAPPDDGVFTPGFAFGPYTVVRRLGRGATGVVLLAEQHQPVRRTVAIKVVPQAMLDPHHAARFDFERQALERTDHPAIARVLDAGRTEHGLPYIVMEFVDGRPITRYAADHALTLAQRVELVCQVANAVQHAHQRGLIHRDLKPANILVAERDGRPDPKVVDFGIARALGDERHPSITAGSPIGTIAYMAPEQASGGVVDTRADIHALAAVLYELVAGRPPASPDAADPLHAVLHAVPPPVSRCRDALPPGDRAPSTLWADLDRVLACALEKQPARRYASADAFAADLRRVLAREPVAARPQTAVYRLARLAERHKPAAAAGVLAVLAVGAGVLGMAAGYAEANRQRALADDRAQSLAAMNTFLVDDLLAAISPHEIAIDTPAVTLLDRAGVRIDTRFADRPAIAGELHLTLGRSYAQLAAFEAAHRHLTKAHALAHERTGAESPETVRARLALESLAVSMQRYQDAAAAYGTLLPLAERVLGPDDPALHTAFNDAGIAYDAIGRRAEGVDLLERALAARRRALGPDDPMVLTTLNNLAQAHDAAGRTAQALDLLLESVRVAEAMPDPPAMLLIGLYNNVGATYLDLGRQADASPHLARAAELASDWLGPEDPTTLTILVNLASLRAQLGEPAAAAQVFERVVRARETLLGPDAFDTLVTRHGLYTAVLATGDAARAAESFAALLDDCRAALGDHWLTAAAHVSCANALRAQGRTDDALPHAEAAADLFTRLLGPDHPRTTTASQMARELRESRP